MFGLTTRDSQRSLSASNLQKCAHRGIIMITSRFTYIKKSKNIPDIMTKQSAQFAQHRGCASALGVIDAIAAVIAALAECVTVCVAQDPLLCLG